MDKSEIQKARNTIATGGNWPAVRSRAEELFIYDLALSTFAAPESAPVAATLSKSETVDIPTPQDPLQELADQAQELDMGYEGREAFEGLFPVPDGVMWAFDTYVHCPSRSCCGHIADIYNAQWKAWQAALQSRPELSDDQLNRIWRDAGFFDGVDRFRVAYRIAADRGTK